MARDIVGLNESLVQLVGGELTVNGDAVMESSTSAPGVGVEEGYIRFYGGVQICWRRASFTGNVSTAVGSLYASQDIFWTFPVAFADADYVSVTGSAVGGFSNGTIYVGDVSADTTSASFNLVSAVSGTSVSPQYRLMAIGTWA